MRPLLYNIRNFILFFDASDIMHFNQIMTFFATYKQRAEVLKITKNKLRPQVLPITAAVTLGSVVMSNFSIDCANDPIFEIFLNLELLTFYQVLGVYIYIIPLIAAKVIWTV